MAGYTIGFNDEKSAFLFSVFKENTIMHRRGTGTTDMAEVVFIEKN